MKVFSIYEALAVGWRKFKIRPWYLFGVSLAVAGLCALGGGNSVGAALLYVVYGGFIALLLSHYDGKDVIFDDLFSVEASRWVSFAFAALIKWTLIFAGLVLLIVPGVYLAMRFAFVELLVIDKGLRPLEALRASSALTLGIKWRLFFFSLISSVLILLGLIGLIVGAFAVSVIVTLATIHIYRQLEKATA